MLDFFTRGGAYLADVLKKSQNTVYNKVLLNYMFTWLKKSVNPTAQTAMYSFEFCKSI
jgi:hypothetical protein